MEWFYNGAIMKPKRVDLGDVGELVDQERAR
jgi:hypothetical protein